MKHLKEGFVKIINFIKKYRSLFVISLITLLCVELLNHPTFNLVDLTCWIFEHKRVMLFNYLLYCNIGLLIYLVINRLDRANMVLMGVLVVIGICNYYKLLMKGENVVLWDVLNLQAAAGIMTELNIEISWQVILCLAILGLVLYHQFKKGDKQPQSTGRFKYFALVFIILSSLTVGVIFNNEILADLKITNMDWNQDKNYRENGFILCFFMNLKDIAVQEPDHYSEEAVSEALSRIEAIDAFAPVSVSAKPNIVVVMNESFSDISIANEGLSFEEPLMPFIDSLHENVIKGNLLVSIFGGGTANTEFEFLTGHSMAHLPVGSVAYDRYIEDECGSMVETLKNEGYEALAIHPYLGTFWNRDEVYPLFGFDHFYTMDDFSEDVKKIKGYVSDEAVADKIISCFEQKEEDQPMFIFTVTMENHTPYSDTSNGVVQVDGDNELFKEEGKLEAGIHARGVQDGDAMYQKLVTYFSDCDEPTIVVMFGDHHPFVSSTINQDADHLDDVNKYKTPFVIWANYELETATDITLDSSVLGAYTLLNAGIDLPAYLKYNYYASSLLDGFNNYFVLGKDDYFYKYSDEMDPDITQYLNDHELLQYDLLFGEKYSQNALWNN